MTRTEKLLAELIALVRSDPTVKYMVEDSILLIHQESTFTMTTDPAPCALDGVDSSIHHASNSDDINSLGRGVDIYVLGETHSYTG